MELVEETGRSPPALLPKLTSLHSSVAGSSYFQSMWKAWSQGSPKTIAPEGITPEPLRRQRCRPLLLLRCRARMTSYSCPFRRHRALCSRRSSSLMASSTQRNPTLPSMSDNIMELDQACMHAVPCYPVYPAWCISAFVTCTTDTTYTVRPESFETESDSVTP